MESTRHPRPFVVTVGRKDSYIVWGRTSMDVLLTAQAQHGTEQQIRVTAEPSGTSRKPGREAAR